MLALESPGHFIQDAISQAVRPGRAEPPALRGKKSVCADEQNCLPHLIRQPAKHLAEFVAFRPAALFCLDHLGLSICAVAVLHLSSPAAFLGIECVAKDSYELCMQVAAGLESSPIDERAQQRLLNEIVGTIDVARQRQDKCTKLGIAASVAALKEASSSPGIDLCQ